MSKKSRKRNKKILAALALAGGAAMLAKGRGKGPVSTAGQAVGVDRITPPSKYITKKVVPDVVPADAAVTTGGSGYLSRMGGAGDKATQLANQIKRAQHSKTVTGVVPPSELVSTARPNRFNRLKGNINAANMEDANIKAPLVDAADAGTKFKKIFTNLILII